MRKDLARSIGYWSSTVLALVGIVYVVVVLVGFGEVGFEDPIEDPILAVMEALTLLAAPLIVVLMASICVTASQRRKIFGVIALSFGGIMAGLTSGVHFVALTAARQADFAGLAWPSTLYAVELLAWDVFLGLSLLSAAFVFTGTGIRAAARWSLVVAGGLSLLGTIGPLIGDMALQRIGILGYGVALPIASLIVARAFGRREDTVHAERS